MVTPSVITMLMTSSRDVWGGGERGEEGGKRGRGGTGWNGMGGGDRNNNGNHRVPTTAADHPKVGDHQAVPHG